MFGKSDSEKTESVDAAEASWRALDEIHRQYFRDVYTAQLDVQESLRTMQTDYAKAMMRVNDPTEAQNVASDFEQKYQQFTTELGSGRTLLDAYEKYRAAIVKVLTDTPAEQLGHTTMAALGHSLLIVANHAAGAAPTSGAQADQPTPPV